MDTIKSLKSRTELLCSMKKGIKKGTEFDVPAYQCIAYISEEKNLKNSLLYLNPLQKKILLDAYAKGEKHYYWNRECNQTWVNAIDEIIINAKRHKKYLDNIEMKNYLKYIEAVATIMIREGALEQFFSMDMNLMCKHINAMESTIVGKAFDCFAYFEGSDYFLHTLTSPKWKRWYKNCHIKKLEEEGLAQELKVFCTKDFQQHKFISCFSNEKTFVDLLQQCKKNFGVVEVLDAIAENDKSILYLFSGSGSGLARLDLNAINEYNSYVSLLRAITAELKGVEFITLIGFSVYIEHDERTLKGLLRKLKDMDELAQRSLFTLPPYMICAWINGKSEIIRLAEKPWFAECEPWAADGLKPYWRYRSCTLSNKLLIHAVKERKNHFIQLLVNDEIGYDELSSLEEWSDGLLQYMNINELNARQIRKIVKTEMLRMPRVTSLLPKGRKYTFNELEVLHEISFKEDVSVLVSVFITLLEKSRSDDACIRMKQYLHYMPVHLSGIEIDFISHALILHDIPQWKRLLFTFDAPLALVAEAIPFTRHQDCLREAKNEVEARFALNHVELCNKGLKNAFKQFCQIDSDVLKLKNTLDLPEQFYKDNKSQIQKFFIAGNGRIANTYLESLLQKGFKTTYNKFFVVLKAAMCDCLHSLRYHERDLEKECGMNFSEQIEDSWMENDVVSKKTNILGEISCVEDTSFEGIMNMGINPTSTCMSYHDGVYLECLLSYFDGNKKIIYIKTSSGKIIARAVLRLTKMVIGSAPKTNLDFVDVTRIAENVQEQNDAVECPVIFLERMYTGYQGEAEIILEKLCTEFLIMKTKKAGIVPVISNEYSAMDLDVFARKRVGIYITKSKAGDQYLDSFGGKRSREAEVNGNQNKREDVYIFSQCFVPKNYFK